LNKHNQIDIERNVKVEDYLCFCFLFINVCVQAYYSHVQYALMISYLHLFRLKYWQNGSGIGMIVSKQ